MSLEATAQVLAEGWPIFPCNPLDKTPLTPHGFKDATTDKRQISKWWKQWPNAMIGVPMGKVSGVFCVDLDRKAEGSDGVATWQQWLNDNEDNPATRMHNTPSTGQHVLFLWREGIRNIPLNKLGPGIEIKGEGGYIVVPPSMTADGRKYVSNEIAIAKMPIWLEVIIESYYDTGSSFSKAATGEDYMRGRKPATMDEVRFALSRVSSDIYDDWYRIGAAIRREFGDAGWNIFDEWSRRSNKYNARDCTHKWKQVAGITNISIGTIFFYADENDPGWRDDYELTKQQSKTQEKQEPQPASKPASKLQLIDYSKWDSTPIPRQEWAVEDRIPMRRVCLFTGEGAAGKSLLQLQLSVAHVLGKEWLGGIPRQGEVLFIDAEDEAPVLHKRLADVLRYYGAKFKDLRGRLHLVSLAGKDAVLSSFNFKAGIMRPTPLYGELLEMVRDIKPVMIGIASSADVFSGNELDRSQVRQFIALLTHLGIIANGAVNLIAHPSLTGINTDTGISGNTAWHNSVRARMYLKSLTSEDSTSSVRELLFKKNNYGPISASIMLHWQDGLFLPITSESGVATKLEVAKEVFMRLLRRFNAGDRDVNDKGGVSYAPNLFAQEKEARDSGCNKQTLAEAMRTLLADGLIKLEPYGRTGSRPNFKLVIVESKVQQKESDQEDMPF